MRAHTKQLRWHRAVAVPRSIVLVLVVVRACPPQPTAAAPPGARPRCAISRHATARATHTTTNHTLLSTRRARDCHVRREIIEHQLGWPAAVRVTARAGSYAHGNMRRGVGVGVGAEAAAEPPPRRRRRLSASSSSGGSDGGSSAALRARIAELNAHDVALYREANKIFDARLRRVREIRAELAAATEEATRRT